MVCYNENVKKEILDELFENKYLSEDKDFTKLINTYTSYRDDTPLKDLILSISMVPLIELRGAIPVSQGLGLPIIPSYIVCILANMVPVPFIYLFARKVLVWGCDKPVIGKFFTWCLDKGERGGKKLQEKVGRSTFVALLLFVGIPLPGTGAWTGALAASILDMDFKSTTIAVMLGVLLAGVIMMVVSFLGFSLI